MSVENQPGTGHPMEPAARINLHDNWTYVDGLEPEFAQFYLDNPAPREVGLLATVFSSITTLRVFVPLVIGIVTASLGVWNFFDPEATDRWDFYLLMSLSMLSFFAVYYNATASIPLTKYGELVTYTVTQAELAYQPIVYGYVKLKPARSDVHLTNYHSFDIEKELLDEVFAEHSAIQLLTLIDTQLQGGSPKGVLLAFRGAENKYSSIFK